MGAKPLSNSELGLSSSSGDQAPFWYYVLKEAELEPSSGHRLGPIGGRLVAEVLIGLAANDPNSFLNLTPGWRPDPEYWSGLRRLACERFSLEDLIAVAAQWRP